MFLVFVMSQNKRAYDVVEAVNPTPVKRQCISHGMQREHNESMLAPCKLDSKFDLTKCVVNAFELLLKETKPSVAVIVATMKVHSSISRIQTLGLGGLHDHKDLGMGIPHTNESTGMKMSCSILNVQTLARCQSVEICVAALLNHGGNFFVVVGAMSILANLSHNKQQAGQLSNATGSISAVILDETVLLAVMAAMKKHLVHPRVQVAGCGLIMNLCVCVTSKDALVKSGVFDVVWNICKQYKEDSFVLGLVCALLSKLHSFTFTHYSLSDSTRMLCTVLDMMLHHPAEINVQMGGFILILNLKLYMSDVKLRSELATSIVAAGGVRLVMEAVKRHPGNDLLLKNALACLLVLASVDALVDTENEVVLMGSGGFMAQLFEDDGIASLVKTLCLQPKCIGGYSNTCIRKMTNAVSVVIMIAVNGGRDALLSGGVVDVLLKVANFHLTTSTAGNCMEKVGLVDHLLTCILQGLCYMCNNHPPTQARFSDQDFVNVMSLFLGRFSDRVEIMLHFCALLSRVKTNGSFHDVLWGSKDAGKSVLLDMMKKLSSNGVLQTRACYALRVHMPVFPEDVLIDSITEVVLVAMHTHPSSDNVQMNASAVLQEILKQPRTTNMSGDVCADVVGTVCLALQAHPQHDRLQQMGMSILACAKCEEYDMGNDTSAMLLQVRCVHAAMGAHADNAMVHVACLKVMRNILGKGLLQQLPMSKRIRIRDNFITSIVDAIKKFPVHTRVQQYGFHTLWNIANYSVQDKFVVIEAGVLSLALAAVGACGSVSTVMVYVCGALACCATDKTTTAAIVESTFISSLVPLMTTHAENVHFNITSCALLGVLTSPETSTVAVKAAQDFVASKGVDVLLAAVLKHVSYMNMQISIMGVFQNISTGSPEISKSMATSQVAGIITALLHKYSACVSLQGSCHAVLKNIAGNNADACALIDVAKETGLWLATLQQKNQSRQVTDNVL